MRPIPMTRPWAREPVAAHALRRHRLCTDGGPLDPYFWSAYGSRSRYVRVCRAEAKPPLTSSASAASSFFPSATRSCTARDHPGLVRPLGGALSPAARLRFPSPSPRGGDQLRSLAVAHQSRRRLLFLLPLVAEESGLDLIHLVLRLPLSWGLSCTGETAQFSGIEGAGPAL